jgi:hypothetical protein
MGQPTLNIGLFKNDEGFSRLGGVPTHLPKNIGHFKDATGEMQEKLTVGVTILGW